MPISKENDYRNAYMSFYKEERKLTKNERYKGQMDMMEWLIRQNEYSKYALNGYRVNQVLRAGEIYEVDFGINVNKEFSHRHFALVLTDSNENNPLVFVCPLKTNVRGAHPSSDLNLGIIKDIDNGHETLAIINQVRAIDKYRIFRKPIIGKKYDLEENGYAMNDCYDEQINEKDIIYRLEDDKFDLVLQAVVDYLRYGYICR